MRNLANDLIPLYEPGGFPTCHATTVVRGKRLVTLSGNRTGGPGLSTDLENVYRVKECDTKGQWAVGVAKTDAEDEALVGVIASPGIIVPITAGAAIAAGDEVITDTQGRVITNDDDGTDGFVAVGRCMTAASGAGVDAEIKLY